MEVLVVIGGAILACLVGVVHLLMKNPNEEIKNQVEHEHDEAQLEFDFTQVHEEQQAKSEQKVHNDEIARKVDEQSISDIVTRIRRNSS